MGILDAPLRDVAKSVVGTFGKSDVTYRVITEGAFSTTTLTVGQTPTDTTITAVVGRYKVSELGNLIRRDDVRLEVAATELSAKSIVLNKKDRLVIDSVVHEIVDFMPVYSGDLVAMYVVQGRRE